MSISIWKKPTVRPIKDCIVVWQNPAHMSFTLPRTARKYMERYNCERWTTLDDLIAQADKAERLQKAVDVANEALKYARQRGLDNKATLFAVGTKADKALDEIRQLIKETTNDNH